MGSKSDYLENAILDGVLGGPAFSLPGSVYVGLWTGTLNDASTGATAGEVSGGGYTRATVANGTANWPTAASGAKANGGTISFPTASADWGTVGYWGILDASGTAANMLYWGALTTSKVVSNGDTARFNPGDLDITED